MLLIQTALAGVIGTLGMSFVMSLIHRTGYTNADMIRALGSLATRKEEGSLLPGLIIHLTSGILFAFPYAIVLTLIGPPSSGATALLGAVVGLFHGIIVSFILLAVVSGMHPVERFRTAGLDVAVAHIVGHVAYGLLVGFAIGLLGVDYNILGPNI